MAGSRFSSLSLLIFLSFMALTSSYSSLDPKVASRRHREEAVQKAHDALVSAIEWVSASMYLEKDGLHDTQKGMALSDCARLYEDGEETLQRLMGDYELVDAHTWLSAAMTAHSTCMEGLRQVNASAPASARNVRTLLQKALALHAPPAADLKDDGE
ncbi:putative pectinesterase/pectinesterase inhibitor 36 [Cocos nucifera]|nr:putative pectinesterase/pectinesterase inhibitor 36 [Cocos nucifera]